MAEVAVRDVSRIFGTFRALDRISVDFENGKLFALLGPSGSGKTTLLRLIAGFDFPDEGHITIGGDAVETVPVEKRDVGMMFQNYALFPNMSVFDNIGFGLSVRGMPRSEIRTRVGETLDLVQLQGLDDRRPHQLSGGQKQRVALARALVIRPRVLLLDEPLSALDKALRVDMQVELKRIQREVGITTIFVTHDQEEALSMADRVGVLRGGKLMQEGSPAEIYDRPNSVFSATFLGDANILTGEAKDGQIRLPDGSTIKTDIVPENGSTAVAVRPEKMVFLSDTNPALNAIEATVVSHVFAGSSITTLLDWQGQRLKVFAANAGDTPPPEGTQVRIGFSPDHTVVVAE